MTSRRVARVGRLDRELANPTVFDRYRSRTSRPPSTPRSLRTCRQAAGVAPRDIPQVLAHGDGFEVGVAS